MRNRILLILLVFVNAVAIILNIQPYTNYLNLILLIALLILTFLNKENKNEKPKVKEYIEVNHKDEESNHNSSVIQTIPSEEETEECKYKLKSLAERYYYFKTSIPIIESLSTSTKEYEEKTLKKVFDQFEEIWNESETIVKDSEKTMEQIFDTNSSRNMGYILNSSKEINHDFTTFLPMLEQMSNLTDKFIATSFDSFEDISKTTKDIEDLAEQVKVISINVRIEAARVKDSGGFKVLGEDITNFADKTTMFAQSTNERIQHTLDQIEGMKKELAGKIETVKDMVNSMYKKVNPFEKILEDSAVSLKEVINDLHKVSGELNQNLKQSLGNLQYKDATNQETQHIIDFLNHIHLSCKGVTNLDDLLTPEDAQRLKKEILQYLNNITTTGNEADQIDKFADDWEISYKEEVNEKFDEVDDGTFLF